MGKKIRKNADDINKLIENYIRKGFLYYSSILKNVNEEIIFNVVKEDVEISFNVSIED